MSSESAAMPLVSVVTAVFNGESDVETACRSVLAQTYSNIELVIVDDASADATPRIIERLSREDARVRYFRNAGRLGQTASLNRGIELSRGKLIARIDADDLFRPTKIARQVDYLARHPEVSVLGTWAMRVTENGESVGFFRAPTDSDEIEFGLLHSSSICHVSVLMRKEALTAVGGYDEAYRYAADFKLWSNIRRAGFRLANIPEVLVDYRVASSTFGGSSRMGAAADEAAEVIRANAQSLCHKELDLALCRAIHLRAEEASDLSAAERRAAFVALGEMARLHFGSIPWKLRRRLFAGAVWSFAVGARGAANSETPRALPALTGAGASGFGLQFAERLGRVTSWIGLRRVSGLGRFVRRNVRT